jgi:hypothetical protein
MFSSLIQIRERMHNKTTTSEIYASEVLDIPSKLKVESIIAVGYPAEKKSPHKREELQYEKVYGNQYGKLYTNPA